MSQRFYSHSALIGFVTAVGLHFACPAAGADLLFSTHDPVVDTQPLTFNEAPTYTPQVPSQGIFLATFRIGNHGETAKPAVLRVVLTSVTTGKRRALPNTSVTVLSRGRQSEQFNLRFNFGALAVGQGKYRVEFIVVDDRGRVVNRFANQPLKVGGRTIGFSGFPSFSARQLAIEQDLVIKVPVKNLGTESRKLYLLAALTPARTDKTVEFYSGAKTAPPGVSVHSMRISGANIRTKVGSGQILVTVRGFVPVGDVDARMNGAFGFYGNRIEVGNVDPVVVGFDATSQMASGEPFQATYRMENRGETPVRFGLTSAFAKFGEQDPAAAKEMTTVVRMPKPPLGSRADFEQVIAWDDLQVLGIGPGRWMVTLYVTDGFGDRIDGRFGNLLTIDDPQLRFTVVPAYSDAIDIGGTFTSRWFLDNNGDAPEISHLQLVMRPLAADPADEAAFVTFRAPPVEVPVGSHSMDGSIQADEVGEELSPGRWLVTFLAYVPGQAEPLARFAGNRLTIGHPKAVFEKVPAYSDAILRGQDFQSTWEIGNTGDAPETVTLLVSIRPADPDDPGPTREFYSKLQVIPVGGGTAAFNIPWDTLTDPQSGIDPDIGQFLITFLVFDGFGDQVDTVSAGNPFSIS